MSAEGSHGLVDDGPSSGWSSGLSDSATQAETDAPTAPVLASRFRNDPEELALRAAPQRVVRFRKGLLIAAASTAFLILAGVSWIALDPASLKLAVSDKGLEAAPADNAPEVLEALPKGYGAATAVPVLGPPLPGDLGRPILAHQREMAQYDVGIAPEQRAHPPADTAAAERERIAAETAQARSAPVLMPVTGPSGARADPSPALAQASTSRLSDTASGDGFTNSDRLRPPASKWMISAGSTIAASLLTGLNSDLPGLVVAQVTQPVSDSASGRAVLIPQGARLLGRYESKVAFGQRRAMLVWERLILPDGSSISLDNAPATDAAGFAGLSDGLDLHTWQLLKGIGLSTLLGVGTQLTLGDGEADLIRALRESAQSNGDRAGQKIVERNLDVAPTITVRPGFPVRVLVHKDLVLPPWRGG
jgi:type IV secretion system protein VirB10